jgi:sugar phosphate isomerase/epimerase
MILLSTGSLHTYGLNRAFELAAEAGYDGLEIIIDQRADTWQVDYLARLSQGVGLPIRAVHSPFLLSIPGWPAGDGERILRAVKLAESLGARTVVAHLPTRWLYAILITPRHRFLIPFVWRRNSRTLRWFRQELPFVQAETSAVIAIEIMPMHRFLGWPINAHVWNNLTEWPQFDHLTLDTTHCATWRVDPRKVYDRADGRVSHIHLSNFDGRQHRLPHQGKLKLDRFLQHVAAAGYEGDIAVETGPEAMETDDEARVKENLAAALAFCRENLSR